MLSKNSLILLWLILLTACDTGSPPQPASDILAAPASEPTPTLIPGLPTSTPQEHSGNDGAVTENSTRVVPSPTPRSTPTPTPIPAERLVLGQQHLQQENYEAAVGHFQASMLSEELDQEDRNIALFGLGLAQLALDQNVAAGDAFAEYLASAAAETPPSDLAPEGDDGVVESIPSADGAYYALAQSYEAQGDCASTINAYERYLENNADMAAYVKPLIADCHLLLGDRAAAIDAFVAAVDGDAHPDLMVALRERLANMYSEDGNLEAALEQYTTLYESNSSEQILGRAVYMAGTLEMLLGNLEAGWALYETAVEKYPEAYESYLALQAMVEAGIPEDDYQRGVVDFYANAFEPAINAFSRYVADNPDHNEDAHLYQAWSYEKLGNIEAALAEIDAYIAAAETNLSDERIDIDAQTRGADGDLNLASAARGWIEKGELQVRSGLDDDAVTSYLTYLQQFPVGEQGPFAAWWAAAITEREGDLATAVEYYLNLADLFPEHEDAPESLYQAGRLYWLLGEVDDAEATWREAAKSYPDRRYGAAALLALMNFLPEEDIQQVLEVAQPALFEDFYALRARDIASDTVPFARSDNLALAHDANEQLVAEEWLRQWLNIDPGVNVRALSARLVEDGRLVRGQKLWQLGRREEAKRELEVLRREYAEDPLASYQLALFYRDLGLYRSSILAATSVLREADVDVFGAPKFLSGLAYPTYYSDLVLAESQKYQLDPLLLFALIRQESLFESFATSSAVAQGLSQVIPDTGQYIAQILNWPDYDNEDLYKPHVGIAFGAFYLAQQLEAFDGEVAVALSAYNGGPGNAARWQAQVAGDIDQYVETVDFYETRQYIERIYTGQSVYRYLYGE